MIPPEIKATLYEWGAVAGVTLSLGAAVIFLKGLPASPGADSGAYAASMIAVPGIAASTPQQAVTALPGGTSTASQPYVVPDTLAVEVRAALSALDIKLALTKKETELQAAAYQLEMIQAERLALQRSQIADRQGIRSQRLLAVNNNTWLRPPPTPEEIIPRHQAAPTNYQLTADRMFALNKLRSTGQVD